MTRISKRSKSECKTNTRARRKNYTQKRRSAAITVQESRKVNHLSKNASVIKKITEFIWSIICTKIISNCSGNQKNIGERVDWEYLTYVRWNSFKNWAQTRGLWLIEKKKYNTIWSKASQKHILIRIFRYS